MTISEKGESKFMTDKVEVFVEQQEVEEFKEEEAQHVQIVLPLLVVRHTFVPKCYLFAQSRC